MGKYIMKRTEILCPNCFKKKLLHEIDLDLYCDECGAEFVYVDIKTKTFKYRR